MRNLHRVASGVYPPVIRRLKTSGEFVFTRAVLGHGWFDLPPFTWDPEKGSLTRAILLGESRPALVEARAARDGLKITLRCAAPATPADITAAMSQVRHMLRLDEDFSAFAALAEATAKPDLREPARAGAGRLLRSPTVFEDLVKLICTTNCTWALTRVMVSGMVTTLGKKAPGGANTFPTPEALAAASPRVYREVIKAGYRSEPLRTLARDVATGKLDTEAWLDPARSSEEIRGEILAVRGAGPYVADNMLKLLGRYDYFGIDSWCRREFSRLNAGGRKVTDNRIERHYAAFGPWRGLALWCDITREWFLEGNPLVAPSNPAGLSR